MTTFNVANAIAAYARNARNGPVQGMEPRSNAGGSFSDMVSDSLAGAVRIGREAEAMSAQAIAGKADLTEVVTAVSNAEVTLQTVVAIRDKVIAAYQEIVRMPI